MAVYLYVHGEFIGKFPSANKALEFMIEMGYTEGYFNGSNPHYKKGD
jgi:hypothetical protein